jgi:hypothetical protein
MSGCGLRTCSPPWFPFESLNLDEKNITSSDGHLPFIKEVSDRTYYGELHCGKRVSGEWVRCDEAEFREAWTDQPNLLQAIHS